MSGPAPAAEPEPTQQRLEGECGREHPGQISDRREDPLENWWGRQAGRADDRAFPEHAAATSK